jgi:hypothetical protein
MMEEPCTDVPSGAAFALLREAVAVAERGGGVVLRAGLVVPAAELIWAGFGVARDVEQGIDLYATPAGISYLREIDDMSE